MVVVVVAVVVDDVVELRGRVDGVADGLDFLFLGGWGDKEGNGWVGAERSDG